MTTTKDLLISIKAIVLDVDGVLTNGSVLITENGEELRSMNVKDGYALQLAVKKGLHVWVISGGNSQGVAKRLNRLGIEEVHLSVKDKLSCLQKLSEKYQIKLHEMAFLGDDVPDLQPMQVVALGVCPADAVMEVKNIAHLVLPQQGGQGAVRALIEQCLRAKQLWTDSMVVSQ